MENFRKNVLGLGCKTEEFLSFGCTNRDAQRRRLLEITVLDAIAARAEVTVPNGVQSWGLLRIRLCISTGDSHRKTCRLSIFTQCMPVLESDAFNQAVEVSVVH